MKIHTTLAAYFFLFQSAIAGEPIILESVCFTPGEDCTGLIIEKILEAKSQIFIQAYSFTDEDIAQSLVSAKERGLDVRAILDKSQPHARGGQIDTLAQAGIPVEIEHLSGIAHNKIMIIDGEKVITGSFNFTKSAENRNAENVIILSSNSLAHKYIKNWLEQEKRSSLYTIN